jgi:tetratricopeptide (TPR) repeat protein
MCNLFVNYVTAICNTREWLNHSAHNISFLNMLAYGLDMSRVYFEKHRSFELSEQCAHALHDIQTQIATVSHYGEQRPLSPNQMQHLEKFVDSLIHIHHFIATQRHCSADEYYAVMKPQIAFIAASQSRSILSTLQDCVTEFRLTLKNGKHHSELAQLLTYFLYDPAIQTVNDTILTTDDIHFSSYRKRVLMLYLDLGYAHFELAKVDYQQFDHAAHLFQFVLNHANQYQGNDNVLYHARHAMFKVHQSLAHGALSRGNYERAEQYSEILEQLATLNGELRKLGMTYHFKGRVADGLANPEQAAQCYQKSIQILLDYHSRVSGDNAAFKQLEQQVTHLFAFAYNTEMHDAHAAANLYREAIEALLRTDLRAKCRSEPNSPEGSGVSSTDSSPRLSPVGSPV